MKKAFFSTISAILLFGGFTPLSGADSANIFKHGNFEKDHEGWSSHSYWAGTFRRVSDRKLAYKGKGCGWLKGDATPRKGLYGRCDNTYAVRDHVAAGERLRFSIMAKGTGKLQFSCNAIVPGEKQETVVTLSGSQPAELTSNWREYSAVFDLTAIPALRAVPVIELTTPGEVYFDEVRYTVMQDSGKKITPLLPMVTPGAEPYPALALADVMIPEGEKFPEIRFKSTMPKVPVRFFLLPDKGPAAVLEATSSADGSFVLNGAKLPIPAETGFLIAAADGATARIAYDVIEKQFFDSMDGDASRIKVDHPVQILLIGDSLTDFDRGCNYADKFLFFLNRRHPGKVRILNVAVRGDFILREEDRYNHKKGVFAPHAYDGMFDKTPDAIFILLGHNDTHTTSLDGFKATKVSLADQEASYRRMIARYREQAPKARIVLISNTRTNYEFQREKALKVAAKGQKAACFGKPENMRAFNEVSKKLCKELNLDYVDLYTPMEALVNRDSLLRPGDGVHVNRWGNDFICSQLLKHFSGISLALPQTE